MNTTRWLAVSLICLGLVFARLAFAGWTTGDPAPTSLIAPRATVHVVSAEVISVRTNGAIRHVPRVTVLHESGVVELGGLTGSFYDYRQGSAESAIRDYVVGEEVAVRLIDNAPYADRTDWFSLVGALWMSVFAAAILVAGGVLALAGRKRGSVVDRA